MGYAVHLQKDENQNLINMLSAISVQWQIGHDAKCAFVKRIPIFGVHYLFEDCREHIIVCAMAQVPAAIQSVPQIYEKKTTRYVLNVRLCAIHMKSTLCDTFYFSTDKNMQCVRNTCCMQMKVLLFLFHFWKSILFFLSMGFI